MFQHPTLVLLFAEASLACFGGYYGVSDEILKHVNKQLGGSNPAFSGFMVPENVTKQWMEWLAEYKAKKQLLTEQTADYYADGGPGGGIPGWPDNWKGLHKGEEGFPPNEIPPWGFKAKNLGLPAVCYLVAEAGNCENSSVIRLAWPQSTCTYSWGYNAQVQECMPFQYSGCGGNENNFATELACYDKCTKPVSGGCDMETDIAVHGMSINGYAGGRRCGNAVKEKDAHGRPVVKD